MFVKELFIGLCVIIVGVLLMIFGIMIDFFGFLLFILVICNKLVVSFVSYVIVCMSL